MVSIHNWNVYYHADGSRGGRVSTSICLFFAQYICMSVYPHDISKTNAARITKRGIQMFHDESWKPVYFEVKGRGQGHQVTKTVPAWVIRSLLRAGVQPTLDSSAETFMSVQYASPGRGEELVGVCNVCASCVGWRKGWVGVSSLSGISKRAPSRRGLLSG